MTKTAAPSAESLDTISVTSLKGVGDAVAEKLSTLGIATVQDVLFHLPYRYQDRTQLTPIGALQPGKEAVIQGDVQLSEVVMRRRRALLVRIADGTGSITLRFFHFSQTQAKQFERGKTVQCFGEARRGPGRLEMVHPEYRMQTQGAALEEALTPFYHATEGVQQPSLRRLTDQSLELLRKQPLVDWLMKSRAISSSELRAGIDEIFPNGIPELPDALAIAHRPPRDANVVALQDGLHPAHRRLAMEELIAHRLGLRLQRARSLDMQAPALPKAANLVKQFHDQLPFQLTNAQRNVFKEIAADLSTQSPMLRLVQGDVGAGKTVVAALAAAQCVDAGYQVALMAPTEILAEQHLLNFTQWFEPLGIEVGWLSGKLRVAQRRSAIEAVAMGRSRIVVGTHALFQDDVEFEKLGLAIIDEQHRFGVHQRLALRNKGASAQQLPHQLIMTATPIPRTLAMTAYADLDCSVIDELPPGRKPVQTVAIESARRAEVIERVNAAIAEGRQVYWVCTLIEESESLQAQAAEDTLAVLQEMLPQHRIGLVHGRLKSQDKDDIMQAFKSTHLDLLVATTVIEVGVDVPNASLMIIENAERLGLSQLHQLRGRVGRGSAQSTCILIYTAPLSQNARERIGIMRKTNDGFIIAQKDLEIRGAGEVLGTKQTGLAEFRIAELSRDHDLLDIVSDCADDLMQNNKPAVAGLIKRWIGDQNKEYAGV